MAHTIAIAGKGGTGKTTFCGLLIHYMAHHKQGPILAVDADANSNLNEVLGEKVDVTLGDVREEIARSEMADVNPIPTGMSKKEYTDYRFNQVMIEADNYDLLVMGRTQGKGCYCFVNDLLKTQIDKFAKNYKYVIVDNEAGMEHISRGVLPSVDTILLVSDCSRRSIQAVARIAQLVKDIDLKATQIKLIVNKVPDGILSDAILSEVEKYNLDLIGVLPLDDGVFKYDSEGKAIVDLPDNSPIKTAVRQIVEKLDL